MVRPPERVKALRLPSVASRPTKKRARSQAKKPGQLNLQVKGGWAYVSINGRAAGTTPVVGRVMKPGRYDIALARPDLSWVDRVTVVVRPGERKTVLVMQTPQ